jgi:hypothetical protein
MLTHEEMVWKMLEHPEVKTEYDALEPEFELLDELLKARDEAASDTNLRSSPAATSSDAV